MENKTTSSGSGSGSGSDDEEEDNEVKNNKSLNQMLVNLERDWGRFNHHQCQRLSSSRSLDDSHHFFNYYNYTSPAPATIMTSRELNLKSPSNESWKVRTNDLAIEEDLRERKAVISSGKLKGRRLFIDFEKEATAVTAPSPPPTPLHHDEIICNDCLDLLEQQLESSQSAAAVDIHQSSSSDSCLDSDSASCSRLGSSSSSDSNQQQKALYVNYKQVTNKGNVGITGMKSSCGRRKVMFAIIALFCMVFMLINLQANYIHDAEVFLVPT